MASKASRILTSASRLKYRIPAVRRWFGWKIRGKETRFSRIDGIDYLEFLPPVTNATDYAELSARVNWYLPGEYRNVGLFVEGARDFNLSPELAPHMDPGLFADPGWESSRPRGRGHLVIRKLTLKTAIQYLLHPFDATLADVSFDFTGEEAYFGLHRAFCTTELPSPGTSVELLKTKSAPDGSAFVLATGPSAKQVDPDAVTDAVRITCNSAVRDHELLRRLRPSVIAFSDPVFHAGPSRYAAAFRQDLLAALESTDAILATTQVYSSVLLAHMPILRDRLAVITITHDPDWHWPTHSRPTTKSTGNVLTNLMLPIAFMLTSEAKIAGCDGRDPSETYFWTHNAKTQYSDELMQAAFDAHPAFFRDQNYEDYYQHHCDQLEELLAYAERQGKRAIGVTPSYIPALRKRGAPDPRTSETKLRST